jgi:hypothetical protein
MNKLEKMMGEIKEIRKENQEHREEVKELRKKYIRQENFFQHTAK